jgi:hypothetical protein
VLAALAIGAVAASTASAAEYPLTGLPEIGRCVKTPEHGLYRGKNCVAKTKGAKAGKGNYEWAPGPGEKPAFKDRLLNPIIETVGGRQIECSFIFLEGVVSSGKTTKISKVVMQGCGILGAKIPCYSNPVEPGTIESTTALKGELGYIPGSRNEKNPYVGWDLKPESETSTTLIEFECGEAKTVPQYKVNLEGSVIDRVKPLNKMVEKKFELLYRQKEGIQNPTSFKGGEEDVLTMTLTPILNPTEAKKEQAGLAAIGEMELEESMEIRSKEH